MKNKYSNFFIVTLGIIVGILLVNVADFIELYVNLNTAPAIQSPYSKVLTENALSNDAERVSYADTIDITNAVNMNHCLELHEWGPCPCGLDSPCDWTNHCLIHFAIGDTLGCGCDTMLAQHKLHTQK